MVGQLGYAEFTESVRISVVVIEQSESCCGHGARGVYRYLIFLSDLEEMLRNGASAARATGAGASVAIERGEY
jgi:hypothetical protein